MFTFFINILLSIQIETIKELMQNTKYVLSAPLPECEFTGSWITTLKSDQTYTLCSESYQKIKFDIVCPYIAQWNLPKQFVAYGSYAKNILKDIENIKFNRVKSLNLWGNNIQSIQGLCRIEMPMLEELWIWSNNIVSIRPLRRANFPNLRILDLKHNKILDHDSMSELKIGQKKLHRIDIGSNEEKQKQKSYLSWVVKMQPQVIKQINLTSTFHLQKNNQNIRMMKMLKHQVQQVQLIQHQSFQSSSSSSEQDNKQQNQLSRSDQSDQKSD